MSTKSIETETIAYAVEDEDNDLEIVDIVSINEELTTENDKNILLSHLETNNFLLEIEILLKIHNSVGGVIKYCINNNKPKILKYLCDRSDMEEDSHSRYLISAIHSGYLDIVKVLFPSKYRCTSIIPIEYAITMKNIEILKYLCDNGFPYIKCYFGNYNNQNTNIIKHAINVSDPKILKYLYEKYGEIIFNDDSSRNRFMKLIS